MDRRFIPCVPRYLPPARAAEAAALAREINPANAAVHRAVMRTPVGRHGGKARLALLIANRWPTAGVKLTVKFLDGAPKDLQKRILAHMNAWSQSANVSFVPTSGHAQVRITRLNHPEDMAGYWSYVGTQILGIRSQDEPTLNLEDFTMNTPESEFHRVVRHEAGHALGFEHEHMRSGIVKLIDRDKAIAYFKRTEGWSKQETLDQVLTPLKDKSLMGTTESDPLSIMCYQLPGAIMKNGKPIPGGRDIDRRDYTFAASCYPQKISAPRIIR
jgi:hypothetical protein